MKDNKENKIVGICVTIVIIIIIVAIMYAQYKTTDKKQKVLNEEENKNENQVSEPVSKEKDKNKETIEDIDYMEIAKKQLEKPAQGEDIAIMHVKNFGDIKIKFFKDEAPKAVENFLIHAKNGYYNGLTFHRVIEEFMIQGGDPTGNGTGGKSIWNEPFEPEVNIKRFPFRGTLAMASVAGVKKSLGSQFFITQANPNQNVISEMKVKNVSKSLVEAYSKFGGVQSLFMQYTVFGQVYEGMDVVDKIAKIKTDQSNDKHILIELKKLKKTVILSTHRLNQIDDFDLIIVMKDGQITEMGTHSELMENNQWYYNQYNIQLVRGRYEE